MFRQLRDVLINVQPNIPNRLAASNMVLTGFRPSQLSEYLETFWQQPMLVNAGLLAHFIGEDPPDQIIPDGIRQTLSRSQRNLDGGVPNPPNDIFWDHLAYAFMIDNSRAPSIFSRVVAGYATGEKLPPISAATYRWLRVTEELFCTNWRQHTLRAAASNLRPDLDAIHRNAYYRLLGMDLNHGTDDGRAYPFTKAEAANRDFPAIFEELLREVWKAHMNVNNFIGPQATDVAAIRFLVARLREMLNSRRFGGALSREEFDAVAMASWFHLTLDENTLVVTELDAVASSPAERLRNVGARVGLAPHPRVDACFRMAEPLSRILLDVENGAIELGVEDLYAGFYAQDMLEIITQWSVATGRDIKEAVSLRGVPGPVGGARPLQAVTRTMPVTLRAPLPVVAAREATE